MKDVHTLTRIPKLPRGFLQFNPVIRGSRGVHQKKPGHSVIGVLIHFSEFGHNSSKMLLEGSEKMGLFSGATGGQNKVRRRKEDCRFKSKRFDVASISPISLRLRLKILEETIIFCGKLSVAVLSQ
jgi:hypothetical protein